jgi:hypothetical protein
MSDEQVIQYEVHVQDTPSGLSGGVLLVMQWTVGTILAFLIGSWLVWWAINLQ